MIVSGLLFSERSLSVHTGCSAACKATGIVYSYADLCLEQLLWKGKEEKELAILSFGNAHNCWNAALHRLAALMPFLTQPFSTVFEQKFPWSKRWFYDLNVLFFIKIHSEFCHFVSKGIIQVQTLVWLRLLCRPPLCHSRVRLQR